MLRGGRGDPRLVWSDNDLDLGLVPLSLPLMVVEGDPCGLLHHSFCVRFTQQEGELGEAE